MLLRNIEYMDILRNQTWFHITTQSYLLAQLLIIQVEGFPDYLG